MKKLQFYRIVLPSGGYLVDSNTRQIAEYTRGEAIKKKRIFGGVGLEKGRTEKIRHIVVCIRKGCVYAAHVSRDLVGIELDIYDFDGIFDDPSLEKQLKNQYKKDIEYKTDLLTEGGG